MGSDQSKTASEKEQYHRDQADKLLSKFGVNEDFSIGIAHLAQFPLYLEKLPNMKTTWKYAREKAQKYDGPVRRNIEEKLNNLLNIFHEKLEKQLNGMERSLEESIDLLPCTLSAADAIKSKICKLKNDLGYFQSFLQDGEEAKIRQRAKRASAVVAEYEREIRLSKIYDTVDVQVQELESKCLDDVAKSCDMTLGAFTKLCHMEKCSNIYFCCEHESVSDTLRLRLCELMCRLDCFITSGGIGDVKDNDSTSIKRISGLLRRSTDDPLTACLPDYEHVISHAFKLGRKYERQEFLRREQWIKDADVASATFEQSLLPCHLEEAKGMADYLSYVARNIDSSRISLEQELKKITSQLERFRPFYSHVGEWKKFICEVEAEQDKMKKCVDLPVELERLKKESQQDFDSVESMLALDCLRYKLDNLLENAMQQQNIDRAYVIRERSITLVGLINECEQLKTYLSSKCTDQEEVED